MNRGGVTGKDKTPQGSRDWRIQSFPCIPSGDRNSPASEESRQEAFPDLLVPSKYLAHTKVMIRVASQ
jgi:hypothetical protein